ncbi:hypothetical protein L6452_13883 [Arctium lappa]|uniref:Uncharacterized protein n=1 Tax=Arctium lappa TaxID=4217 RepID=A0ACB9CJJ5_ARCLA|nr:hypothetical protein L6452_13883 [Arctium lappa]
MKKDEERFFSLFTVILVFFVQTPPSQSLSKTPIPTTQIKTEIRRFDYLPIGNLILLIVYYYYYYNHLRLTSNSLVSV